MKAHFIFGFYNKWYSLTFSTIIKWLTESLKIKKKMFLKSSCESPIRLFIFSKINAVFILVVVLKLKHSWL